MTSMRMGHVTKVFNFISSSINHITTKPHSMVDDKIYFASDDDVTKISSLDKCLWFYLHFFKPYNNQT